MFVSLPIDEDLWIVGFWMLIKFVLMLWIISIVISLKSCLIPHNFSETQAFPTSNLAVGGSDEERTVHNFGQ